MKRSLYILFFLLTQTLIAQLNFTATISKQEVALNQRFKITYALDQQGADNFKLPNMNDFTLVGGPMNSYSQSNINGKISFLQSYTFFFKPIKKGSFTIPPATVVFKGKTITSNALKIKVTSKVATPKNPNDPQHLAQENIHVVAEISNTNPYVGQAVYVSYKLYVSDKVSAYNPRIMALPKFNGFWNQEIDFPNEGVKKGTYKGAPYRFLELKRTLLIPQKSGKLILEPMKVDLIGEIPTGRRDYWGNAQLKRINFSVSTGRRTVHVKSLPLDGQPSDFNGAVGDFSFSVTNTKPILKSGESSEIIVKVKGVGNLKLFELPKIHTPPELEVYTPIRKDHTSKTSKGLKGNVFDTYTVVPEYKGKYQIPPISFSYFDLKEKTYKTLSSKSIVVEVTEGKDLPITTLKENTIQKKTLPIEETFNDIVENTKFSPLVSKEFFKSTLFYMLLLLPLFLIPIGMFIGKKKRERSLDVVGNKMRKANKMAKKYLAEAQKHLGNKEAFYIALEKALHNFLKAKLQVETSDISKDKIAELLANKHVNQTTINKFSEVLDQCNFARYTPTTNVQMQAELEKAKHIIVQIDQQLKN